jgi:hypothetical protein
VYYYPGNIIYREIGIQNKYPEFSRSRLDFENYWALGVSYETVSIRICSVAKISELVCKFMDNEQMSNCSRKSINIRFHCKKNIH